MKTKRRVGAAALIGGLTVLVGTGIAQADHFDCSACRWANPTVYFYNAANEDPRVAQAYSLAVSDWNALDTRVRLLASGTSSPLWLQDTYIEWASWSGLAIVQPGPDSGPYSQADAWVNIFYTRSYPDSRLKGVPGHEIGHALGLCHHPEGHGTPNHCYFYITSSNYSVMNAFDNTRSSYVPTWVDRTGLTWLYP